MSEDANRDKQAVDVQKQAIGALLDQYMAGGGELFDPRIRPAGPDARDGKTLTISGVAVRTASGPAVRSRGEDLVLLGHEDWADDVVGERVEVTGTFLRVSLAPDPGSAGGEVGHGAAGASSVLSGATWALLR